jgi:hypothetical protein
MARLTWYGGRVADKVAAAAAIGVERTMSECVSRAKDDHPAFPPASEPYTRFHSRSGFEVGAIVIMEPAALRDVTHVGGRWGADSNYALFLEIGTSTDGPTAEQRALEAGGDMSMIAPAIGPLMAPRPFLRPAADAEYPLLATRIGAAFRGETMA